MHNTTRHAYDTIASAFEQTPSKPWREMFELQKIITSGNVLDLGCGDGRLYEIFKDNPKIHYLGIDVSAKMIEVARKRYVGAGFKPAHRKITDPLIQNNPYFLEGEMTLLTLRSNYYDAIIMTGSYHHVLTKKGREKLLNTIKRALKDDGVLILTVWNIWNQKTIGKIAASWWRKITFREPVVWDVVSYPFRNKDRTIYRYYKLFTARSLVSELCAAGFVVTRRDVWKNAQNRVFYLSKS